MSEGIGAMLHYLSGGSENDPKKYYGKKITRVALNADTERLEIDFEDGTKIDIWDDGQSCCESRYLRTDDNLNDIVGGTLTEIKVKEVKDDEDGDDDCHEIMFLELVTDKGSVVFSAHNEHNGYYGGFGMTITERA